MEKDFLDNNYKLPEKKVVYFDEAKEKVSDDKDLTPFQIIKLTSQQLGIDVKQPNKNCKKCYGRGFDSIESKTRTPMPCFCIFTKEDKEKYLMSNMQHTMNRKTRRSFEKTALKRARNASKKNIRKKKRKKKNG